MTLRLVPALGVAALLAACATAGSPDPNLYSKLGDGDVRRAAATLQASLETARDGERLGWRNASSGHAGSVRPLVTYVSESGEFCRRYEETLALGAEAASYRQDACRGEDGYWAWD
jgi:surface antigen